jgi:hypothetical protein
MPALAEPITLLIDHEPLDDDDLAHIRAALDESHLVTVHTPSWSLTIRCGVLVRIGFHVGAEGHAAAIAAVESSSVWSSLGGMGIVIAREVVVALARDA